MADFQPDNQSAETGGDLFSGRVRHSACAGGSSASQFGGQRTDPLATIEPAVVRKFYVSIFVSSAIA